MFPPRIQLPLQIWSAACSSGEKPLSVAMALEETGGFQQSPIEIRASNVSPTVIERARRELFRERSLRHLPLELRTRYFTAEGELWKIAPKIHGHINWHLANLLAEEEIKELAAAHIIFFIASRGLSSFARIDLHAKVELALHQAFACDGPR